MSFLKNMFSLEGKRVLITGAGGFFGQAFVRALVDAGAERIYALDSDFSKAKEITAWSNVEIYQVDLNDEVGLRELCDEVADKGVPDVVINNAFNWKEAGFGDQLARLQTLSEEHFAGALKSDWWAIRLVQHFLCRQSRRRMENIINVASMYGLVAPDPSLYEGTDYFNPLGYGLAKASMIALTRYMAAWLGPNIRANALVPGAFPNFGQSDNSEQNKNSEFIKKLEARTLLKRFGDPVRDLAGPMLFLASEASRYMTGQILVVDGGWTVT